ncbi:MAG: hypothetical protein ACRDZ7_15865 [Acidimicrobiia bacterium]
MRTRRTAFLVGLIAAALWFVSATVLIPVRVSFDAGSLRCGTVLHPDQQSEIARVCPSVTAERLSETWPTTAIFGVATAALFVAGRLAWQRRRGVMKVLLAGGAVLGWFVITALLLTWITGAHRARENSAAPITTTTTAAPATTRCGQPASDTGRDSEADFDGDGRLDTAYHRERTDGSGLWDMGVCLATGQSDDIEIGPFEGVFYGHDLDGDGRAELVYGGTSAIQQLDLVAVFVDGQLRPVEGSDLLLASGPLADGSGQGWGCDDIDGDGRREVIQVTVKREGTTARWTKEAYRLAGVTMPLVRTWTGTAPAAGDPWEQADSLAGRC